MRSLALSLSLIAALLTGACGLLPDQSDETAKWSVEKLYSEAKDALNDGAYDKSIKYYEKLQSRFPYGRYAQQAQLEAAYAHYKQQEPAAAIAECERFIRSYPNHPSVDYAYYLKGLASFNVDLGLFGNLGDQDQTERDPKGAREAFDAFKELAAKFPASKYAEDSRQRMTYLINALAEHEVHVADYYLRRGAPLAAANRAQYAIKTYPGAPASERALYLLMRAYEQLGTQDLRNDAERVLQKNFPKSAYLAGGAAKAADKPWWKLW